jgi:cyclic pyranopterin phosphate synthase
VVDTLKHDGTMSITGSLTHVDAAGEAHMVDVGGKVPTVRTARVGARVWMAPATMAQLQSQALPKGDVLAVARVAGIMAAKRTSELVPLCHPLALTHVDISFSVADDEPRLDIECTTRTEDRTGVEMEALTGATVAAITIYDMCKAIDRSMIIGDVRLLEKTGGKEHYLRPGEEKPLATAVATTTATTTAAAPSTDRRVIA